MVPGAEALALGAVERVGGPAVVVEEAATRLALLPC